MNQPISNFVGIEANRNMSDGYTVDPELEQISHIFISVLSDTPKNVVTAIKDDDIIITAFAVIMIMQLFVVLTIFVVCFHKICKRYQRNLMRRRDGYSMLKAEYAFDRYYMPHDSEDEKTSRREDGRRDRREKNINDKYYTYDN